MFGDLESVDVYELVCDMLDFVLSFEGDIPGATPRECGNYSEQNLNMAQFYARKYRKELEERRFTYEN